MVKTPACPKECSLDICIEADSFSKTIDVECCNCCAHFIFRDLCYVYD